MSHEWPSAVELADSVRRGERRATDLLDEAVTAIEAGNGPLNAFVHLDVAVARQAAEAVDVAVARGEDPGPLAGVPFGVKDLEDCAGMPTSHGSRVFLGRPPVAVDSVHVARLRAAGAVPVGKTAAPEFGAFSWTASDAWGVTRNPWALATTPGGSSGGSAAAVSAGLVPFATASDGGGSIRTPAAFCGLVGLKPSQGRIPDPRPDAAQIAVVGALTTTVRDAARHLDVAAGPDHRDRLSLPSPDGSYETGIEQLDVVGLRARWSPDLGFAAVEPEVIALAAAAAQALADAAGLQLDDAPVLLTDPVAAWLSGGAVDPWLSIEAGTWPAVRDELGWYQRYVMDESESTTVPALAQPYRDRHRLQVEVAALFDDVDVVLTPATAVPAFVAEGPAPSEIAGRHVHPAMATPFGMLANLCGNPAVSVPAGVTAEGLPVGLQIMPRRFRDDVALRLARIAEQVRPWPRWAP